MITLDDYFMGRDVKYASELTSELRVNAAQTVTKVNQLLAAFGESRSVTSGWRPPEINANVPGAAQHSKHMTCQACDLSDDDGSLDAFCVANQDILESIGLWLEDPAHSPKWTHVQIVSPHSGNRVFIP